MSAAMDGAWHRLTDTTKGEPRTLTVLGRPIHVPQAANGTTCTILVRRFVRTAVGGTADYIAIARAFSTLFIDRIPKMGPDMRDAARRFVVLIDTLYDEGVKLVCSAAAPPRSSFIPTATARTRSGAPRRAFVARCRVATILNAVAARNAVRAHERSLPGRCAASSAAS